MAPAPRRSTTSGEFRGGLSPYRGRSLPAVGYRLFHARTLGYPLKLLIWFEYVPVAVTSFLTASHATAQNERMRLRRRGDRHEAGPAVQYHHVCQYTGSPRKYLW